jgi:hypothetical protein
MRSFATPRCILGFSAALVLLAGCGVQTCPGIPSAMRESHPERGRAAKSWMLREASSETLLYYTDGYDVYAIRYPGGKLVGTITGLFYPRGVCSDSAGDLFVTESYLEDVVEYAHGSTQPIAKLPDYGYYALGCAVDAVTGNLAVANVDDMNGNHGNVAIYAGAKGKPSFFAAPGIQNYDWVAYDGSGNLYVNGSGFAEMPFGGSGFTDVSLPVSGVGIHWDGQYLAMVNPTSSVVYRLAISGSSATVAGTVDFRGLFNTVGNDFALQSGRVVMPFYTGNQNFRWTLGLWRYPHGGKMRRRIHRIDFLQDLTLSI